MGRRERDALSPPNGSRHLGRILCQRLLFAQRGERAMKTVPECSVGANLSAPRVEGPAS